MCQNTKRAGSIISKIQHLITGKRLIMQIRKLFHKILHSFVFNTIVIYAKNMNISTSFYELKKVIKIIVRKNHQLRLPQPKLMAPVNSR